jgi:hypothetical protein
VAVPTNAAGVKKTLANPEPSTQARSGGSRQRGMMPAIEAKADGRRTQTANPSTGITVGRTDRK